VRLTGRIHSGRLNSYRGGLVRKKQEVRLIMKTSRLSKLVLAVALLAMLLGVTAVLAQDSTEADASADFIILVRGQGFVAAPTDKGPNSDGYVAPVDRAAAPDPAKNLVGDGPLPFATLVNEGFENVWPTSPWLSFDNNGATGGNVCWDDENDLPFAGAWSGWPAGNCTNGVDGSGNYLDNMDSWMTAGPRSLAGRNKSTLKFKYWLDTESGFDFFYYCASPDNSTYYCPLPGRSGNSGGWTTGKLNLKSVPGYGNMLGDASVWIGFVFQTDGSVVDRGVFVDSIKWTAK
jgi:hypothetical protein